MTADALKAHLLRNNMKRTGTKCTLHAIARAFVSSNHYLIDLHVRCEPMSTADLVARVSQAMVRHLAHATCVNDADMWQVLGAIPTCPSCGGGKPDFNIATEMYSCPGYFDDTDFQRCFRKFGFSDITRGPWLA